MITQENLKNYHSEGYCILKNVIPEEYLNILDKSCEICIEDADKKMRGNHSNINDITHPGKRYFIANKHKEPKFKKMKEFLFSQLMAQITSELIGDNVYLFNEQFVVKAAEKGMKFAWHQDSGYIGYKHTPYLTCWIPMIDMTEENGTVYVLPFSQAGTKEMMPHTIEEGSNDKVGYNGNQEGIPVIVNRGDLVCFSSVTFHRSSPNISEIMRPAYIAQYSPDMIMNELGDKIRHLADPLVLNGEMIQT